MRLVFIIWFVCSIITLGLLNGHKRCAWPGDHLSENDARESFLHSYAISLILGPVGTIGVQMFGGLATQHQLNYNFKPMTEQEDREQCWTIAG